MLRKDAAWLGRFRVGTSFCCIWLALAYNLHRTHFAPAWRQKQCVLWRRTTAERLQKLKSRYIAAGSPSQPDWPALLQDL